MKIPVALLWDIHVPHLVRTPMRDNEVRPCVGLQFDPTAIHCRRRPHRVSRKKERRSPHSIFFPAPSPGEQVKTSVTLKTIRDLAGYFSDFAFTIARIFS